MKDRAIELVRQAGFTTSKEQHHETLQNNHMLD